MNIPDDIPELLEAGVIDQETAERLRNYYREKDGSSTNPLFIVFGIVGAILVGLGIILIIAHNWDQFSIDVKTILAFVPLVSGQLVCAYALLRKTDSAAWREGGASFLIFAVGACIALVSQIYNIPGNLDAFMLTWLLLSLPLVYVMRSAAASLLYIVGAGFFAVETGYLDSTALEPNIYWLLLLGVIPYYYRLVVLKPNSNSTAFHNWLLPSSAIIALGTVINGVEELMIIAYMSLFGLLYLIGRLPFFDNRKVGSNGYRSLGSAGTTIFLILLSFDWFWESLRKEPLPWEQITSTPDFIISCIPMVLAAVLFLYHLRIRPAVAAHPVAFLFLLFVPTFFAGLHSSLAVVLINIYVLVIGIVTMRNGAREDHLGLLNYGLLIISILAVCRFFDRDLSFVARGIMFVSVGIGFFLVNYYTLKRRRNEE